MASSLNKTPRKVSTPPSQDLLITPRRTHDSPHDASQSRRNTKSTPRVRGLDEIKPFLKQVGKIVTEESQKWDSTDEMPWYNTWESWDTLGLLEKTSMNSITNIICPDLLFNDRTIKAVVTRCIGKIPPIKAYIQVTHLSDKLVTWISRVGDI